MVQLTQLQVARIFSARSDYPSRLDLLAADVRRRRLRYQTELSQSSPARNLMGMVNGIRPPLKDVVASSGHTTLHQGTVLDLNVDVLVNATNTQLRHEGGLAAALVARGGPGVRQDSERIGWCDLGSAVAAFAWELPARFLIHVPTIDYVTGKFARLQDIGDGTRAALELAQERGAQSVGLPLLGSGNAGLPTRGIALVMLATMKSFPGLEVTVCAEWPEDIAVLSAVMGH